MPQAVDSEFLSYANDTVLVFQHKDTKTIEEHLNLNFSTISSEYVHFGEDKTKSIRLFPKHRSKTNTKVSKLKNTQS